MPKLREKYQQLRLRAEAQNGHSRHQAAAGSYQTLADNGVF
jgi:hypothetical protein